jgi:uncharacterized membrane protein YhaH (DUF805 family)
MKGGSMRQAWNFLMGFRGRFSREEYVLGLFSQCSILALAGTLLGVKPHNPGEQVIAEALAYGLSILCLISWTATHVKRWHDLGMTGWHQLAFLIPLGQFYVWGLCGFAPGEKGKNMYGEDPLQDSVASPPILPGFKALFRR